MYIQTDTSDIAMVFPQDETEYSMPYVKIRHVTIEFSLLAFKLRMFL